MRITHLLYLLNNSHNNLEINQMFNKTTNSRILQLQIMRAWWISNNKNRLRIIFIVLAHCIQKKNQMVKECSNKFYYNPNKTSQVKTRPNIKCSQKIAAPISIINWLALDQCTLHKIILYHLHSSNSSFPTIPICH